MKSATSASDSKNDIRRPSRMAEAMQNYFKVATSGDKSSLFQKRNSDLPGLLRSNTPNPNQATLSKSDQKAIKKLSKAIIDKTKLKKFTSAEQS